MNNIEKLQNIIDSYDDIVFFTGAGVSTGSGIKDFRGKNGIYKDKSNINPEYLLSIKCFNNEPELFYDFYKNNMNSLNIEPNVVHKYLKKLEDKGKLKSIITQNIDGLHEKAGCKNVIPIHGTIYENHCILCGKSYSANYVFDSIGVPRCTCTGIIKPDVVLYGESLYDNFIKAQYLCYTSKVLIVLGTSLLVEPAASLVGLFKGEKLVIINASKTPYDNKADLVIHEDLNKVFELLK